MIIELCHDFRTRKTSLHLLHVIMNLYRREAWFLMLKEERRPRVFENRVLREIFGSKRDEVTGKWRRLHNKELYDQYYS